MVNPIIFIFLQFWLNINKLSDIIYISEPENIKLY